MLLSLYPNLGQQEGQEIKNSSKKWITKVMFPIIEEMI